MTTSPALLPVRPAAGAAAAALAPRPTPLPVGQLWFPDWDAYEATFRDLFDRQYYTNHGPLAQRLEARLAEMLQVRHVICVTNATIGLVMAVEALGLTGKVIVPSFTFIASAQCLSWTGITPVFCEVDPVTHQIDPAAAEALIDPEVSAILAVNLWGDACDTDALQAVADRHGIALFFDSAHAMGCRVDDRPVGGRGALEVFSFHATKVFSSAEGGCITTNDDALAARLRNIRSSYGAGKPVDVVKTSNGRMSEAQAAIGLLNLDKLPQALTRNREIHLRYRDGLAGIPGVTLYEPSRVSHSNHQYIVCTIDAAAYGLSRDGLLQWLQAHQIIARRYFTPGAHRSVPYVDTLPQYVDALPITDRLNEQLIQLPCGAMVSDEDVALICRLVAAAPRTAPGAAPPGA